MADSEEMRRLILHAATLLEVQRDRLVTDAVGSKAAIAAMSHGNAVLRMVAACMGVEEPPQPAMPLLSATPEPEPPADGPRRTRRMGAQS